MASIDFTALGELFRMLLEAIASFDIRTLDADMVASLIDALQLQFIGEFLVDLLNKF